jgi:uncharacterized protein YdaL
MTQTRISRRVNSHLSLISVTLALIFFLVLGGIQSGANAAAAQNVLVLYDSTGDFGWGGDLDRQLLMNLLSHFNVTATVKPVETYAAGDIEANDATFYIGAIYGNPLPAGFISDFLLSTKTVCWLGYNLDQVAWIPGGWNQDFFTKFGVDFLGEQDSPYSIVNYKGKQLTRQTTEASSGLPLVFGTLQADPYWPNPTYTVVASAQYGAVTPIAYITHTGNLWYVADNPLRYITITDRFLAFADVLYDILGITYNDNVQTLRAHVRIEDVSPAADPAQLKAIADYLYAQNVPFSVAVIPEYHDPLGTYNNGVPVSLNLNQAPAVAIALQYMVARGGKIVQHGMTHQDGSTLNCYTGVTADDYEFYQVFKDPATLRPIYQSPIPGDSTTWAANRINRGRNALTKWNLAPVAWSTPHYVASPADYAAFKTLFPLSVDRGAYFSTGTDSVTHVLNQLTPYVIPKDVYGIKRLPENLGYISEGIVNDPILNPYGFTPEPAILPADLIAGAQANLVVRDGWASFYFHWDLWDTDPTKSYLQATVEGIKALRTPEGLGYTFVPTPTNGVIN